MNRFDYSRQYSRFHSESLEHANVQARCYSQYLRHLALPKSSRVLDVGCEYGFFLLAAKQYGIEEIIGVDNSPQQIAVARNHQLPAEYVENTESWLISHAQQFDAITLFDVLEHVPVSNQIDFLSAVRCALKVDGILLTRVPNASSTFAGRMRWGDWTHQCAFTEFSLDFALHNAGFRDIAIQEDHFGRYPLWIPRPSVHGVLRAAYFGIRRLQAAAEFGWGAAGSIPLTVNIVSTSRNSLKCC